MMGEIEDRLTVLETTLTEWREAHNTQSKIVWDNIKEQLAAIFIKLDETPARKIECMKEVNKKIGFALGLPVTIGAILSIIILIVKVLN